MIKEEPKLNLQEIKQKGYMSNKPSIYLTNRFQQAVAYATEQHMDQTRKGTEITYICHPLGVASLVLEAGGDEDMAIAALLHDVPEDCGGESRLTEIKAMFGIRVERIVKACSDSLAESQSEIGRAHV